MSQAHEYNEEYYDRSAEGLEDFRKHNPGVLHRLRMIARLLDQARFESVLDVGCGSADLLLFLKERYPGVRQFAGADLSPVTVERARKRFPGMRFEVLNIETSRINATFDAVVCTEVIEHLPDQQAAINNLSAMLNPGGYLVLTCPTGPVFETERVFGHTVHPTLLGVTAMAERAGLEVVQAWNWGWPMYRMTKVLTNLRPEMALKAFAGGRYGMSQRVVSFAIYALNFLNRRSHTQGCQLFFLARKK